MINLSGKFRYFLCTDNVTLRFRHRGLREYIKSKLHRDPCNHNGEILTEKILHAHRFTHPIFVDKGKHVYHISWSSFVYLLEGIIRKERDEYFDEENGEEITGEELSNIV